MLTVLRRAFCPFTLVAAAFFSIAFFSPAQAHATDGQTAVGLCIDSTASGDRCAWSVNGKGEIDICNKSGCVYCPSATSQCTVADKKPGGPIRSFPVGTTVTTTLGTFKVHAKAWRGPILEAPPTLESKK